MPAHKSNHCPGRQAEKQGTVGVRSKSTLSDVGAEDDILEQLFTTTLARKSN